MFIVSSIQHDIYTAVSGLARSSLCKTQLPTIKVSGTMKDQFRSDLRWLIAAIGA